MNEFKMGYQPRTILGKYGNVIYSQLSTIFWMLGRVTWKAFDVTTAIMTFLLSWHYCIQNL